MSNVDENEYGSDEDMFSPKKNRCKTSTSFEEPVDRPPGCKERLVNTFKRMLTGVPPPPDYTNPDFHVDKILTHWKENQDLVWDNGSKSVSAATEESLGICLNTDNSCEELELLGRQICERYIWSETSAVTSCVYVKLTQSAKKRRKANGWGLSPRTRISYLTRRMTTFQRDNIAAAVASNKTTQILVAKNDTKKGSSGKCDFKGKRALFQSPENKNKYQTPEQGKDRRLVRKLLLNSSPQASDRSRYSNGEETAKSSEKRRCSRSLFSSKAEPVSSQVSTPVNQNNPSNVLSTQHRQKMLWAVTNALKAVKIRMTDPEFKTFAGPLFKATTQKWRASLDSPSSDKKVSTSDTMLAAAKSLVEGITGRKMSPKSAKKNPTLRSKIKTPVKAEKRDENNPPSIVDPAASVVSMAKDSEDGGVFPLEQVGVLAEKLDPGGNSCYFNTKITSRKRKLEDERDTTKTSSILISPQPLRTRTPSKTTGGTPKKLTFHPSVVDGTSKQSSDSPIAKKMKLTSSDTPSKLEVLRARTPSKVDSTRDGTPKKIRFSPLKLSSVQENSKNNGASPRKSHKEAVEMSPRVLRMRTTSEIPDPLTINHQRVTPKKLLSTPSKQPAAHKNEEICKDSVRTPNKSRREVVDLSSRVLRTRTPPKTLGSTEMNHDRQTPVKLRSTPSKQSSSKENEAICTNSSRTPPKTSDELKSILVSPRVLRIRTPLRITSSSDVCNSKSTPNKLLFAPVGDNEESVQPIVLKSQPNAVEKELVSPRVLRMRTPTKIPESPEISRLKVTPRKLRSTPSKQLPTQKNEEILKDSAPTSSICKDEGSDDRLPPVLRPQNVTVRRSSRRCSTELLPPVLKMEISDVSPPTLSLEE